MTLITVAPIVLKNVLFQVDVDDYAAHVSKVEFIPTPSNATWKGLSPSAVFNGSGLATWVANIEGAQDWTTVKSLSRYLYAHEGESKVVKFQPAVGATAPLWTVTLAIVPCTIGGTVDTVPTFSVTMQCAGKPVPDYDNTPGTPNPAE
jgi:hypothetical protein